MLRLDWLGGYKRFKETDPGIVGDVSSLQAPFQRFRYILLPLLAPAGAELDGAIEFDSLGTEVAPVPMISTVMSARKS